MITIDVESWNQLKSPLDLDRKCDYLTCPGNEEKINFPDPSLSVINDNIFFILKNSVEKPFEKKYSMKPSYLSYDEYGNNSLGEILMYVNNIYCVEDFDMPSVIIPKLSALVKICTFNFSNIEFRKGLKEINW